VTTSGGNHIRMLSTQQTTAASDYRYSTGQIEKLLNSHSVRNLRGAAVN
jgi:hypothetical protein